MNGLKTAVASLMVATLLAGPASSLGKDRRDHDHDRARAALQAGEIMPLPALLEHVSRQYPGHVLELELERDHEQWIYELKVLQADGALLKLKLNARTGDTLRRKNEGR